MTQISCDSRLCNLTVTLTLNSELLIMNFQRGKKPNVVLMQKSDFRNLYLKNILKYRYELYINLLINRLESLCQLVALAIMWSAGARIQLAAHIVVARCSIWRITGTMVTQCPQTPNRFISSASRTPELLRRIWTASHCRLMAWRSIRPSGTLSTTRASQIAQIAIRVLPSRRRSLRTIFCSP